LVTPTKPEDEYKVKLLSYPNLAGLHCLVVTTTSAPKRGAGAHLESGGTAAPTDTKTKASPQLGGPFYLPPDVEASDIDQMIRAKLSGKDAMESGNVEVLERRAGGRVVAPAAHLRSWLLETIGKPPLSLNFRRLQWTRPGRA
jgi:hypothetical protein